HERCEQREQNAGIRLTRPRSADQAGKPLEGPRPAWVAQYDGRRQLRRRIAEMDQVMDAGAAQTGIQAAAGWIAAPTGDPDEVIGACKFRDMVCEPSYEHHVSERRAESVVDVAGGELRVQPVRRSCDLRESCL